MAVTISQRLQFGYAAGFRGDSLITMVAISLCECGVGSATGCETGCCDAHPTEGCAPTRGCGVLQFDQRPNPGTATCAIDPACAFRMAWTLSQHGTNFNPWCTYKSSACGGVGNNCYSQYIGQVKSVAESLGLYPVAAPPPSPAPKPPPQPPPGCPSGIVNSAGVCQPGVSPGTIEGAVGEGAAIALVGVLLGAAIFGVAYYDAKRKGLSLRRELSYEAQRGREALHV